MNRLDRLVALIILLQSRKLIRGREIADYFNISLRTVYRDINTICEAGVPVSAESGEGYSIMEGYHLPPVMFTSAEAAALFTGAKFSEYFTDASIKKHGITALTKIKSVLPQHAKNYLEKLQDSMMIFSHAPVMEGFRDDVLALVQEAIVSRHVLKIEYYALWKDAWTERMIEPLGMAYFYNHWHIIAWCRLRNDIRDFRADRLKKIIKTDVTFKAKDNSFIKQYTERVKEMDAPQKVTIKATRPAAFSIQEKLFPGFETREAEDSIILDFWSPGFGWLSTLLLSYATEIEIIGPQELKKMMAEKSAEIARHYAKQI